MVPPGRTHAFRNTSGAPARHLAIASPAEAMAMIEELSLAGPEELPEILSRYQSRLAWLSIGRPTLTCPMGNQQAEQRLRLIRECC
jgi:hypothetical protein